MPDKWVKRWKVPNSNGDGFWTVAMDKEGNYGCSCPAWKFQRLPFAERIACHHIIEIQGNGGQEVKAQTLEERNEARLRAFAEKGFRYLIWVREPPFYQDRRTLEDAKLNPDFEAVKTFKVNAGDNPYRVIVVKEKEIAYKRELDQFITFLKKCNLRKHRVKNPYYESIWNDKYWLSQEELRERLRKRWFDITQHIIYNSTGTVNPNLPEGSVYNSGEWGKRIVNLERAFNFLR
ncbi:hypothetical protein ES703_63769 [subsurface metagenome]